MLFLILVVTCAGLRWIIPMSIRYKSVNLATISHCCFCEALIRAKWVLLPLSWRLWQAISDGTESHMECQMNNVPMDKMPKACNITVRAAMLAQYYLSNSVCLSVRLSICHTRALCETWNSGSVPWPKFYGNGSYPAKMLLPFDR